MPKKRAESIGVLLSGGLDSAALVGWYLDRGYRVHPIYISAGLRWEKTEIFWAKRLVKSIRNKKLEPLSIVPVLLEGSYDSNWSRRGVTPGSRSSDSAVYLPARNLLLIVKALLRLYPKDVSTVALATLKGNPFPDGKPGYFRRLGKILSESFSRPVKILTPFRQMKKKGVIQKNSHWPIELSFSCINPKGKIHCGRCNKCAERKKAFREARVPDKTIYARG